MRATYPAWFATRWLPLALRPLSAARRQRLPRFGTISSFGPSPGQTDLEAQLDEICTSYPDSITRALAFITCNVAVRRQILDVSQGFVPLLVRGEDTDLGLQLALRGARFAYESEAEAIHLFSGWTSTPENDQDAFEAPESRRPLVFGAWQD